MAEFDEDGLLGYLRSAYTYFLDRAKIDTSFSPEASATGEILHVIASDSSDTARLSGAADVVNRIADEEHYRGSMWTDVRKQILLACQRAGLDAHLDTSGERIKLQTP